MATYCSRLIHPIRFIVRTLAPSPGSTGFSLTPKHKHPLKRSGYKQQLQARWLCSPVIPDLLQRETELKTNPLHCAGCGIEFQTKDQTLPGFTLKQKLKEHESGIDKCTDFDSEIKPNHPSPLICQRCFSLKHYNTALNITLKSDDYLKHLSILRDKRALILLMIDVTDYPSSVFPKLHTLISPSSRVLVVANKTDLLPKNTSKKFWKNFSHTLRAELTSSSLTDCSIIGVQFVSARTGFGLKELCDVIINSWGNRGDVYLLGCTNVGKSTLFNNLLTRLCGARPGQLSTSANMSAPTATISQWPGTTLGLLSFPLLSVGKIRRLRQQQLRLERSQQSENSYYEDKEFEQLAFDDEDILTPKQAQRLKQEATEVSDVLEELGIGKKRDTQEALPLNKYWLHDTPGAINEDQLINHLTTKELKLALPKKPLKPRTFILQPDQCLFIGGLARIDYLEGPNSTYFTVFAASHLPIHISRTDKADRVYRNLLGTPVLKIPMNKPEGRLESFPPLKPTDLTLTGTSWKSSVADIVLSSAGWVALTLGVGEAQLRAYTPLGRGVVVRRPSLYPLAVNERGKNNRTGNWSEFRGK